MTGLNFGLDLGLAVRRGLLPSRSDVLAFNPRALYDLSESSSVWQDAGATPAGAGDVIGQIDDLTGNGHHATQTTAAKKPIRRSSGSSYYAEADGIDDFLAVPVAAVGAVSSSNTVLIACRLTSTGNSPSLFAPAANNGIGMIFFGTTKNIRPFVAQTTRDVGGVGTTDVLDRDFVFTFEYDRTALELRGWVDDAIETNVVIDDADKVATTAQAFFSKGGGAIPFMQGRLYGAVIFDKVLTTAELTTCRAWLEGLHP